MIRLVVRQRLRGRRMNDGIFAMLMVFMTLLPQAATGAEVGQDPALSTDRGDLISPSMGREVRAFKPMMVCETPTLNEPVFIVSGPMNDLSVSLSWSGSTLDPAVSNFACSAFYIDRKLASGDWDADFTYGGCVTTNSFINDGGSIPVVKPDSSYSYRVTPQTGDEKGECVDDVAGTTSNVVTIGPITVLNEPTATAASGKVVLGWTAITSATGYKIERKAKAGSWPGTALTSATNSYTDTAGTAGDEYDYRVRATVSGSDKSWSNIRRVEFPAAAACSGTAVTDLKATATPDGINLAWTDGAWGTCTSWEIERSQGIGASATPFEKIGFISDAETTRAYADDSGQDHAQPGNSYTYRVSLTGAVNPSNEVPFLNYIILAEPVATAGTGVVLRWNNILGVTGYTVERKLTSATSWQSGQIASPAKSPYTDNDPDAIAGTPYDYRVRASGIANGWSNVRAVEFPGGLIKVPDPPTGVTASLPDGAESTIKVVWTAPADTTNKPVSGYTVQHSLLADFDSPTSTNPPGVETEVTLTGLTACTPYFIRVQATNSVGVSGWNTLSGSVETWKGDGDDDPCIVPPTTAPDPPTEFRADKPAVDVGLRWAVPETTSANAVASYRVEYGKIDDFSSGVLNIDVAIDSPSLRTLNHGGGRSSYFYAFTEQLEECTGYYFRLRAVNGIGISEPSGIASGTTRKDGAGTCTGAVPTAVTDLDIEVTKQPPNATVTLSWVAGTGQDDFIIESEICGSDGWISEGRVAGTDLTYDDAQPCKANTGGPIKYRVAGRNSTGYSDWLTATDSLEIPDAPQAPPDQPRDLEAVAAANGITLTWKAPTTSPGSPAITGYRVEHSADQSTWTKVPVLAATVVMYLHADAPTGKKTYYRVFAINSAGDSPAATVSATMNAGTPGAPTGLVATAGAADITLKWIAPADRGFSAILNYKVQTSLNAKTWTALATTDGPVLTYVHAAVASGQTTYYRVIAVNTQGDGPPSNTVNATIGVGTASSAPRELTTKAATNGITLTWLVPATPGSTPTTSYRIERSVDAKATWQPLVILGNVLTHLDTGVAAGVRAYYRVFAINQAGNSPASNIADATMVGTTKKKPTAPKNLSATAGTIDIALAWQAPADTGSSAIKNYRIERSANGTSGWSTLATVAGTATSHDDSSARRVSQDTTESSR